MIRYNEPLCRHTSFRIGGPAYCWVEPDNPGGILEAIDLSEAENKNFIIIGKGTNLLFKDAGFDGLVIHLAKGFEKIEKGDEAVISADSGVNIANVVRYALDNSLTGCEFLTGIPGNLGGAIFMNAGTRRLENPDEFSEIKDIVLDVKILDLKDKKIKVLNVKEIDFRYRFSGLDGKVVLSARLGLKISRKDRIQDGIKAFNKKREWLNKIGLPNAGSIFKNPSPDKPAGMLIENCGLKGKRIGGAEISKVHANIIVNIGNATANDVMGLIDLARTGVRQKFGIELELELKLI